MLPEPWESMPRRKAAAAGLRVMDSLPVLPRPHGRGIRRVRDIDTKASELHAGRAVVVLLPSRFASAGAVVGSGHGARDLVSAKERPQEEDHSEEAVQQASSCARGRQLGTCAAGTQVARAGRHMCGSLLCAALWPFVLPVLSPLPARRLHGVTRSQAPARGTFACTRPPLGPLHHAPLDKVLQQGQVPQHLVIVVVLLLLLQTA